MHDHFAYLLEEPTRDFFQKIANDEAGPRANQPAPMTKTASAVRPPATAFEKVAGRLDRDLGILKEAGACGVNGGMQHRANAYIDVLLSHTDLTPVEFGEVFDKVAATAIETDLHAAYGQLCDGLPEHEHHLVDEVLIKVGMELTELAMLEKEAFIGLAARGLMALGRRAIPALARGGAAVGRGAGAAARGAGAVARGAGRALSGSPGNIGSTVRAGLGGAKEVVKSGLGAAGRGAATAAKEVGKGIAHPFQAAARGAKNLAGEFRAARRKTIMDAPEKLENKLMVARNASKDPGLRGTIARGQTASLEKDLNKAQARATTTAAREAAGSTDKAVRVPTTQGKDFGKAKIETQNAPTLPKRKGPDNGPAETTKVKTEQAEAGRETGAAKANEAATPPAPPASSAAKNTDTPSAAAATTPSAAKSSAKKDAPHGEQPTGGNGATPPPPGGAEGKPPGFMDAWKKATNGGWKSLSGEEKGALIRGGVTAAMVYRGVTGKGAVTGGEGII